MSQDSHLSRTGCQPDTDRINRHQGHSNHLSSVASGQTDGDSIFHPLIHVFSSGTVEPQLMQTGLQGLQLDYSWDRAHWDPRPEADLKTVVSSIFQQERTLRRKPKCGDLRGRAAYQRIPHMGSL